MADSEVPEDLACLHFSGCTLNATTPGRYRAKGFAVKQVAGVNTGSTSSRFHRHVKGSEKSFGGEMFYIL